jgi:hypothetical protein
MVRGVGNMMWQQLSWLEWQRSLWLGKPNRDFFWLTVLLSLTLLLAMLLWGSQRGLLNQFIDVSIGYIEKAGIPIWVAADTVQGINRDILTTTDFKLYPYREVAYFEVALIDKNLLDQGDEREIWPRQQTPFTGWAVSFDDPLWKMGMSSSDNAINLPSDNSLPLVMILNKSLFEKYFNCNTYLELLQQQLPFWQPPSPSADPLSCLVNQAGTAELWLDVKVGSNRQLIPFQVIWQQQIPTLQDLAFLFPLSTLNMLTLNRLYTALDYQPQMQASQIEQVKQVMWQGFDEQPIMKQLSACFPQANIKGSRFSFQSPIFENWLIQCTQQHQIPLKIGNERIAEPYLQITEKKLPVYDFHYDTNSHWLTIACFQSTRCRPCDKVADLSQALGDFHDKILSCEAEQNQVKVDMISAIGNYLYAFAYVENREELVDKVEEITHFRLPGMERNIFYVHSTYEDALVRFMFIDNIMKILEIFYSPFFLAFLIVLLWVQIGIVIAHRKHNYGIYLSKGLSATQVRLLVLMQMALSLAVALGITIILVELMQWQLAWQVYQVTTVKPYIDHIIAGQLDLLPVSWQDYLIVGGIFLLLLYLITEFLLIRLISARRTEPAYLIG